MAPLKTTFSSRNKLPAISGYFIVLKTKGFTKVSMSNLRSSAVLQSQRAWWMEVGLADPHPPRLARPSWRGREGCDRARIQTFVIKNSPSFCGGFAQCNSYFYIAKRHNGVSSSGSFICHRNIQRKPFRRKASIIEDIEASVDLVLILPMGCIENCNSPIKKLFEQFVT